MKRRPGSKRSQAPLYPTLLDGRRLLLAGILGLSGCGITEPYDPTPTTTIVGRDASGQPHPFAPDAGELMMGVAADPGLDASIPPPGPDAGEFLMGEAPEPGLDASVPGPDASDLLMGDIAAPELDASTPAPGPDASDLLSGGAALPEDAGE